MLYAVCLLYQAYRVITTMEFDRNLRFAIDLNNFPEFARVRLWTIGIWYILGVTSGSDLILIFFARAGCLYPIVFGAERIA